MTTNSPDTDRPYEILRDHGFQAEIAQLRARAALSSLPGEPPEVGWTYQLSRLLRNSTAALIDIESAISEGGVFDNALTNSARRLGQIWESISRLSDGQARWLAQINAILAYELAGYQANSVCIAREVSDNYLNQKENELTKLIARFFRRQFMQAISVSTEILGSAPNGDGDPDAADLMKMAAEGLVAGAIVEASRFFLSGNESRLDRAFVLLAAASTGFESIGAVSHFNLVRLLQQTLPRMKERSTWQILGPVHARNGIWQRYLMLLARGLGQRIDENSGIVELWPSQMTALSKGLLEGADSTLVRMPTSAGKTRIAEMVIVNQLVSDPEKRCIYIAPFNALAGEIEESYAGLFSDLGFRLSTTTGAYESDEAEQEFLDSSDVIISTPEKLDFMLRVNRSFFDSVGLIVVDEGQLLEDVTRGVHFELLLSRIRGGWPEIKFLSLSAVIPQDTLEDLAAWLGPERSVVSSSEWRPAVQRHAMFEWRGNNGRVNFLPDPDLEGIEGFLPKVIEARTYTFINPETGRRNRVKFPDPVVKAQTAAELAYSLAPTGAVLVFCPTRRLAESVGKALMRRIDITKRSDQQVHSEFTERETPSSGVCADWLGADHDLTVWLRNGIAVHHGGVPDAVKKVIERDFRERRIQVIVATSTLAQGVNLPIKTVIFHSSVRYVDERHTPLTAREYWNIAGRAGRAGEETEGLILHLCQNEREKSRLRFYASRKSSLEPLRSALLEYLSHKVDERISEGNHSQYLDADLLAVLAEEEVEEVTDEWVRSIFSRTLAAKQAERMEGDTDALSNSLGDLFRGVIARVPEKGKRAAFATTGFSVESCQSIVEHIHSNAEELRSLLSSASLADRERLTELLFEGCFMAQEMRPRSEPYFEVRELAELWLAGYDYPQIREIFGDTINASDALSVFIEDTFGYRLPWGLSAYLRLASHELEMDESSFSILVRFYPSMVKFGVPTPYAVWAINGGVSFRGAAVQISEAFVSVADELSANSFFEWASRWTVEGLHQEFGFVGPVLEDVAGALQQVAPSRLIRQLADGRSDLFPLETTVQAKDGFSLAISGRIKVGDIVQLRRDYDLVFSRNAIACLVGEVSLGLISNDAAQLLAPMMDAGFEYEGKVQSVQSIDGLRQIGLAISSSDSVVA